MNKTIISTLLSLLFLARSRGQVIDLFTKKSKTRPSDLTASEMGSKSEYPTIGAISHIGGVTF